MPELWLGMGWKVLVHLPPHIFFCRSVKKYGLGSGSVDVSQGMVELVRELGGMVADKQADLEVPYWVADEDNIEVMKVV